MPLRRRRQRQAALAAAATADSLAVVPHDTGDLSPHRDSLPRKGLTDVPAATEYDEFVVAHGSCCCGLGDGKMRLRDVQAV